MNECSYGLVLAVRLKMFQTAMVLVQEIRNPLLSLLLNPMLSHPNSPEDCRSQDLKSTLFYAEDADLLDINKSVLRTLSV